MSMSLAILIQALVGISIWQRGFPVPVTLVSFIAFTLIFLETKKYKDIMYFFHNKNRESTSLDGISSTTPTKHQVLAQC